MAAEASRPRCLAITGPTASGKTEIALELAEEFPIEILSMDSAMVYRGMDIGTAKPAPELRSRVPHHLIDIRDPEESYSAGRFAADAESIISAINARGRLPLVVGGTMLYLRALREGIAPLPERNPAIRAELDAAAEEIGWSGMHARLGMIDPEAAQGIEPQDRQRIQRALEVHAITGKTLSELQRTLPRPAVDVDCIALVPADRNALAARVASRFATMLEQGFIDEIRRLYQRPGLTADSQSMRAVGYRQLWAWCDGRLSLEEAGERALIATRQLAKRQLTWLRSDRVSELLSPDDPRLGEKLRQRLRQLANSA